MSIMEFTTVGHIASDTALCAMLNSVEKNHWSHTDLGKPLFHMFILWFLTMQVDKVRNGMTPLSLAAMNGNIDLLRILLENKAALDVVDSNGRTAVNYALSRVHKESAEYLLSMGALLGKNEDAFIDSAACSSVEIVRQLVESKSAIDSVDKFGYTALAYAISNKNEDTVKYLQSLGAPLGKHAFFCGRFEDNIELITQLLLSHIPSWVGSREGRNALFFAAKKRHVGLLKLLVEGKAAIDGVDSDGDTAVAKAICGGNKENAEYLLSVGAPLGVNCLSYAASWGNCFVDRRKRKELVKFVLSHSPSLVESGHAIFCAAQYCGVEILILLVEKKAGIGGVDSDGDTAVAKAILAGRQVNAEYLLSIGAPLGATCLACAVLHPTLDPMSTDAIVRFTLSKNPLINEPRKGTTALFLAAQHFNLEGCPSYRNFIV